MTRTVQLAFLGDVMLGRNVSRALNRHPPEWFWGDTLPILRETDAAIANLESPITEKQRKWAGWKAFRYRADPASIEILTCANIRFVTLANNHILDYRARGLVDTLDALDSAGIVRAGAGRTLAEAAAPVLFPLHVLKIGIMAATDTMPEFAAGAGRPGTHFVDIRTDRDGIEAIRRGAEDLRVAGADLVVLTLHWGRDLRTAPNARFRHFARTAVEAGVDIVHGHSAHVFQGIERHRGGLILYDMGNIIDDYWKFPFRRTFWSLIAIVEIANNRMDRLRIVPVRTHPWPVSVATGETRVKILERLQTLCVPFGTELTDTPEGFEILLR
jgi:poly-gamma-glutamate synthesis protein (capsule biosynthesis protein)